MTEYILIAVLLAFLGREWYTRKEKTKIAGAHSKAINELDKEKLKNAVLKRKAAEKKYLGRRDASGRFIGRGGQGNA